jgi:tRNA(Ile)-lysidine synthase
VSVLRRLSDADRRNALRYWLALRGLGMPDARRLREIAGPMLEARHDALPQVRWPGGVLRRHGDLLYAARPETGSEAGRAPEPVSWNWRRAPRVELPGGGSLELIEDPNGELRSASLPARLTVAFRRADGSVAGLPGGRTLKRALQEGPLPPWERARVPLIYAGRRLLAVGDWWRAPECSAAHGARTVKRCRLRWRTGESGVRI